MVQRKVEKLNFGKKKLFEEQAWLTHAALLILTAYLAGIILAVFRFNEPNPFKNASFLLFALGVSYAILAGAINYFESKWLRKGMLLCFLISLILNISLLLILGLFNVLSAPDQVVTNPEEKVQKLKTFIEYDMTSENGKERERREYEMPVEAGQPEFEQENPIGKQVTANSMPKEVDVDQSELESKSEIPMPKPRKELAQTVPRFSDLQGSISRQSTQAEPVASKPTDRSDPNSEAPKLVELKEAPSEVQRAQPDVAQKTLEQELEVTTDRPKPDSTIARKEPDNDAPEIASAEATLPRSVRSPMTLPKASIAAASSEAVAQKANESLEPNATLMKKQNTTSPNQDRKIDPNLEVVQRQVGRTTRRNQPLPQENRIAKVEETSPRRATLTHQPNAVTKVDPVTPVASEAETEPLQPATTQVVEKSSTSPQSQDSQETQTSEISNPVTPDSKLTRKLAAQEMATERPQQVTRSEATSKAPSTVSASNSVETAQLVSSTATQVDAKNELTVSPMAIQKSIVGVTGSRAEPNFSQDAKAETSLVKSSSTSAKRANPTQEMDPGPALLPSDSPMVKRAVSGEPRPTFSSVSKLEVGNVAAGAKQPKELDASSSSMQKLAASNALRAPSTSQVGESNVDIGPTRIVTNSGQARASGGGQPEINTQTQGAQVARSTLESTTRSTQLPKVAQTSLAPSAQVGQTAAAPLQAAETSELRQKSESSTAQSATSEASSDFEPAPSRLATQPKPISRTASVDATISDVATTGGGNALPAKTPRGRTVQVDQSAEVLELPGSDASSGVEKSIPLAAQQAIPDRISSGIPSRVEDELTGAFQAEKAFQGKSTGASETSIQRRTASPAESGRHVIADINGSAIPKKRARSTQLPSALASEKIEEVPLAGNNSSSSESPISKDLAVASSTGPMNRSMDGGLMVNLNAKEGVGGLFLDSSTSVGLQKRRATPESENIIDVPARFVRKMYGGPPVVSVKVDKATEAFQNRLNRKGDAPVGGKTRPSSKTEAAIELGLVFLAKQQLPDGSWSLNVQGDGTPYPKKELATLRSDTAATSLALLSFLGAGYHHRDDKYAQQVHDALKFLIERQKEDGDLYAADDDASNLSAWLYSHAIATIALCEAYGMTQDPTIKEPAQRALDFIVASQNQERGGWRYTPGVSSDTSVTGWMMMALRSGELSNLEVPKDTFENIKKWLQFSQVSDEKSYQFRYNPFAADTPKQRHGRFESTTMTSVGLLMRLYSGWRRDRKEMIEGAEYLLKNLPKTGPKNSIERDTYYWYYATQVMFHMRGKYWKEWNDRLHPMLVKTQVQTGGNAGSWNPMTPVPDRWGPHGGRLYVTTMNLLSLEVYYRHLPIYVDTAK